MNLKTQDIFDFITKDFEKLWDALLIAYNREGAGGNFIFASHSIVFLEWVCRILHSNKAIFQDFSNALFEVDRRYFSVLTNVTLKRPNGFNLPSIIGANNGSTLIDIIYAQIRNGHSHTYFQNYFQLADGKLLGFAILMHGNSIAEFEQSNDNPSNHLNATINESGHLLFVFSPAQFCLDIKSAILKLGLNKFPPEYPPSFNNKFKNVRVEDIVASFNNPMNSK